MLIKPAARLVGEVNVPGDKSISHRAAMLAAIAEGRTRITNFSPSNDCASTVACLRQLGVRITGSASELDVEGVGKYGFRRPSRPLECGNSGTTMRLLAGILAGQSFPSILKSDESLRARPMQRVIEPLHRMGAEIDAARFQPPLWIKGGQTLRAITYRLPIASAQIKSCVLLAGLHAEGRTTVIEETPTRDHTERLLSLLKVDISCELSDSGSHITINGKTELHACDVDVPGDISSAAFFMASAACLPRSEVNLPGVGLNPTRTAIMEILARVGVQIDVANERVYAGEPAGDVTVRGGIEDNGDPLVLTGKLVVKLIDEIPILAILGTQLEGGLEVRDAHELRVKESDRIKAIVENLQRMNADVEELPDGFRVRRSKLKGAVIDPFGDHRIAMAFAVAGLLASGETEITGHECVDVSFPGYFRQLNAVVG